MRQLAALGALLLWASFIFGCDGTRVLWLPADRSQEKAVCLTFDDGPNGIATEQVLDALRRHQVQATFFLIGKNVEREPGLARRIVEEGHLVGNHSYAHDTWLAFQSTTRMRENLTATNEAILQATGTRPRYFRPPNGLMTSRLQRVCRELELTPVGVHIFVHDSFKQDARTITRHVLKQIRGGFYVMVLHDGFGMHVAPGRAVIAEALDQLIPELHAQGYRWVTPDYLTSQIR